MTRRTTTSGAQIERTQWYRNGLDRSYDEDYKLSIPDAEFGYFDRSDIIRNPEWARRRLNPNSFASPNGYNHSSFRRRYANGYLYSNTSEGRLVRTGVIEGGISHSFEDTSFMDTGKVVDQAVTKALLNLKDLKIDLSVAFAEREQVSKMMLAGAKSIASCINSIKKGNLPKAARDLFVNPKKWMKKIPPPSKSEIPNIFLGYKYGVDPLLQDIDGACRALASKDLQDERYRVKVTGNSEDSDLIREDLSSVANVQLINFISKRVRAYAIFHYQVPNSSALSQAASLGLTNPFSTAWDTTYLSFVIDWFSPVGDFLSTIDAATAYEWLGGCTVAVSEVEASGAINRKGSLNIRGHRNLYKHDYHRQVYSVSPRPYYPHLNTNKSSSHVASGLALLASAASGIPR